MISSKRPVRVLRVGRLAQAPALTRYCLPARHENVFTGFAVHNHVDHLCKTAPDLCAHWGNAGDRVTGPRP